MNASSPALLGSSLSSPVACLFTLGSSRRLMPRSAKQQRRALSGAERLSPVGMKLVVCHPASQVQQGHYCGSCCQDIWLKFWEASASTRMEPICWKLSCGRSWMWCFKPKQILRRNPRFPNPRNLKKLLGKSSSSS